MNYNIPDYQRNRRTRRVSAISRPIPAPEGFGIIRREEDPLVGGDLITYEFSITTKLRLTLSPIDEADAPYFDAALRYGIEELAHVTGKLIRKVLT